MKKVVIYALIICTCLLAFSSKQTGRFKCEKIGDSEVDSFALTIDGRFGQSINGQAFQQDAVASHKGYQYLGYYNAERQVCIARRKISSGDWQVIKFDDYLFESDDAHNTISIGICSGDGTIHMAFDHHVHPLHYRVSQKGTANRPEEVIWQADLFGPIKNSLTNYAYEKIEVTYPRFFQTPSGGLNFRYRRDGSGNGDNMMAEYDPKTSTWSHYWQIDSRDGMYKDVLNESLRRNAYVNGYDYGPDGKLHATWVWREKNGNGNAGNHDLMYVYSENGGRSWKNNFGEDLKRIPYVHSPGITVVEINRNHGLMNTHGQAIDSEGRTHVVMWHCTDETIEKAGSKPGEFRWGPPEARRYHHYWRTKKGKWEHFELPMIAGNRPKIFIDKDDNAILIYGAMQKSATLDHEIYSPQAVLTIAAASYATKWTDWHIIHEEEGSFLNEMLGDFYRWKSDGILSIMVQETPKEKGAPSPLRILDFTLTTK